MDARPRRRRGFGVVCHAAAGAVAGLVVSAPGAWAQSVRPIEGPAAQAVRTDAPPRVDGRLDDSAWQAAPALTEFRQKEPHEGHPATEATRVRLVYTRTHLYIGAELADTAPALIRATERRRDQTLESDDTFAVLLDTYHDHRNAFLFRVNAHGTRFDGIIRNEARVVDATWDEDWTVAVAVDEGGWRVEMAIPFKILRFSGDRDQVWGLNFERVVKRKNELDYWAGWTRDFPFTHVSQAGVLTGLQDIRQADRVRLRPYVMAGAESLPAMSTPSPPRTLGEVGIEDLKVGLTSNLTADVAVNPDFAQAEVDAQRVNLTRFSLFFPERRQFFIEGAESLKMGVDTLGFGPRMVELVYTRTMGLSPDGHPVPITLGAKLTGKARGFDLGLLGVRARPVGAAGGETFAVGRVRRDVSERSYVGAIVTSRSGNGVSTRVTGADARIVAGKYLTLLGLVAASSDAATSGARWVRQVGAEWLSDLVQADVNYVQVDEGFTAGSGYVRRHDRLLGASVSWRPRPRAGRVRQVEVTPNAALFHDPRGVLQSATGGVSWTVMFQSGDRLAGKVETEVDRLPEPFDIAPGVRLAPGRYQWSQGELSVDTFDGRRVSGRAEANIGRFYTGGRGSYELGFRYRPGPYVSVECDYEFNDVDLREGRFHTHLLGLKSNVSFTNDLSVSGYLQYNSTGELAAVQLRLSYLFRSIDNVYLVYNETRYTEGVFRGRSNRSLVLKATYSAHW